MASELRITTLANLAATESVDTTYVINGSAKAWLNWRYNTNTYSDSFNISSGSDLGTGNYRHSFSSATGNNNYVPNMSLVNNESQWWTQQHTTTSFDSRSYTGSAYSDQHHLISVHGDLA